MKTIVIKVIHHGASWSPTGGGSTHRIQVIRQDVRYSYHMDESSIRLARFNGSYVSSCSFPTDSHILTLGERETFYVRGADTCRDDSVLCYGPGRLQIMLDTLLWGNNKKWFDREKLVL